MPISMPPRERNSRSESHVLVFDRGRLLIEEVEKNPFHEMRIPEEGTYILDETAKLRIERMPKPEGFEIPRSSDVIAVDADRLQMPLTVRLPQGRRPFHPLWHAGQ